MLRILNRRCRELAQICRDLLLDEKWVLAPSLRVGHQWLDRITLAGAPVVNVRVKTLKSTALDLAGSRMVTRGLSLVSHTGSLVLVNRIATELSTNPDSYLSSLSVTPTLARSMMATVTAIRLSGLGPNDLSDRCFEAPEKAADLVYVLTRYMEMLRQRNLVDYADVLRMAGEEVDRDVTALGHVIVIVSEDLDLTAAERQFLAGLPQGVLRRIAVDQPVSSSVTAPPAGSDAQLLGRIFHAHDCPPPVGDGMGEIFHAAGEANEIREVLRRCLSEGYQLDEVELLHTDSETYVPLVFETLMRVELDPQFDRLSLPVTFAEGIPVRYSRPGRALAVWLDWIQQGYPQGLFYRMVQEGLLELPGTVSEGVTFSSLAAELRSVRIGAGRENYLPMLRDRIASVQGFSAGPAPSLDSSGESPHRGGPSYTHKTDVGIIQALEMLVTKLLELSPASHADPTELLSSAAELVSEVARRTNELDNYAAKAILERIDEMAFWLDNEAEPSSFDTRRWLSALPDEIRVGGSGPRPGCLHVAPLDSGGHSGRAHTFVVGLDDSRFPGAGLNDPLLLDAEREKLSPDLPKAASQITRRVERLGLLLAGLQGTVTMSFSSLDLADDRGMFPCSLVLSAYRILSGNHKGDQTDMMSWLPPPAGFAPEREDRCLDPAEWWLWRLCTEDGVTDSQEFVESRFPHLSRGRQAAAARQSANFSEYDGRLLNPPADLDPFHSSGPVMSTARLEQMGRCPLSYFFRYVLRIRPPDSVQPDLGRWLEPGPFGELLHEIFYRFMSRLISERRLPLYDRDRPVLVKILEEQVHRYARIYPPPAESAFHRQLNLLEHAVRIFLIEEEELCRRSKPMFLEAAIGLRSQLVESPLNSDEPVSWVISPGNDLRVNARIDRIDLAGEDSGPVFVVWDYKSGSSWKYDRPDTAWQGRVVQHAVYVEVARAILRKRIAPTSEVSHFGYFFPSAGARGLRILRWRNQLDSAREIIEKLCRIASTSSFLATDNFKADCTFCDYRVICGDVKATAAASRRKLENQDNESLQPIRELRGIAD